MKTFNIKDSYIEIGKLIHNARTSKGISQQELADKINLTRTSITNIEKRLNPLILDS